jgi:hypothetical protein
MTTENTPNNEPKPIDPEALRQYEQYLAANPQLNLEDDEFYPPVLPEVPVGELPVGFSMHQVRSDQHTRY